MHRQPGVANQKVDALGGERMEYSHGVANLEHFVGAEAPSMLWMSMDMYELGSAIRITRSRRFILGLAKRLSARGEHCSVTPRQ